MSELVHQIGELFLRAVPVALVVLLFYVILRALFFQPLLKIMAERDARTIGAQKAAEAAQAAATEKVKQYQDALKQARAKVYAEQELERKKILDERTALLKDARAKANAEVSSAKQRMTAELTAAKTEIEATAPQLAAEIVHRVLEIPGGPSREAR